MVAVDMGGGERVAQWFEWRRGMATDILDAFSAREARLDALWTPVGKPLTPSASH